VTSTKYAIRALSIVTEWLLSRWTIRGASRRCLTLDRSRLIAFGALAKDVHGNRRTAVRSVERVIGKVKGLILRGSKKTRSKQRKGGKSWNRCRTQPGEQRKNEGLDTESNVMLDIDYSENSLMDNINLPVGSIVG